MYLQYDRREETELPMIGIHKGFFFSFFSSTHLHTLLFDHTALPIAFGVRSEFYFPILDPEEFCIP